MQQNQPRESQQLRDKRNKWFTGYAFACLLCVSIVMGLIRIATIGPLPSFLSFDYFISDLVSGCVLFIGTTILIWIQLPDTIDSQDTQRLKAVLWTSAVIIGIIVGFLT